MFTNDYRSSVVDVVAGKLLATARIVALAIFGFLPLLFIPSTSAPIGYTKVFVASIGLLAAVVFFAFSILRHGTVRMRLELPTLCMWAAFAVATVSAFFSGDFADSFWGTEVTVHSALFVGILALAMTVWTGIGVDKKTVIRLYLLLAVNALVLACFHIARIIFGNEFLSFGLFGGSNVASPFNEWNSLGLFFGLIVILSLIALEQLTLGRIGKLLFAGVVLLSLVMLAVINFSAIFIVLGLVSLTMLIYALTKGKFRVAQVAVAPTALPALSIIVSMVTLVVSVLFVVGGSLIGGAVSQATGVSYIEVRPSFEATVDIARHVYADHALLGSGPNRFMDAWRLYHDPAINTTIFWNTTFQSGYGFIPTVFVTHGVLGGMAWLLFLGALVYVGIRTFWQNIQTDVTWYFIAVSAYAASIYLWGMSFVYVPGPVLLLLAAACTGIFFAARQVILPENVRTYSLFTNQRIAFSTVGVTVLLVVASVGSVYFMGRHYAAAYSFVAGAIDMQSGRTQEGLEGIARAFALSNDDIFARRIALYEQQEVVKILQANVGGPEAQNAFETALAQGIEAGKTAVTLDTTDPDNWDALGRMYATVVPINMENAYQLAKEAFEKAASLDPQNPSRLVVLSELELLQKNNAAAREYASRAITLKSNYTDAMYVLAQIEIADGNVGAAIESTRAAAVLDANNPVRFFQLGVLELSQNRHEDAARSLERAVTLSADYANARYFLAFAYDFLGRKEDAKSQLESVLALNPDSEEVKALIARLEGGQSLSAQQQTSTPSTQPLTEVSENTGTQAPVTSGVAPESPDLTPVNAGAAPQGE